ncbi:class I SAM-dependent methyltransferase [Planctomicrobium sp. SH664]|uniref:class I SAM-dependent methyltransferase n=1 Tax=Planctomicrobium sp. SH664 TaxID=3448125 RepID=UPI003F5CB408
MTFSPVDSTVVQQLAQLAEAAGFHARDRHGVSLSGESVEVVDRILDRERLQGDAGDIESIVACYGAWFGEFLIRTRDARWTGLHEPVSPRVQLQNFCYAPLDAVRRRLAQASAPSLQQLVLTLPLRRPTNSADADINREAWGRRARDPRFAQVEPWRPLPEDLLLTALDPWLQGIPLQGMEMLCLAAGGGTHAPLYAQAGARVTVVDFSAELLEIDEQIAGRYGLSLQTCRGDLRDLSCLPTQTFDLVLQPVSTCYVQELAPMYVEVARALKPGGLYLSQHKSPASLQAGEWNSAAGYSVATSAVSGGTLQPTHRLGLPQREGEMIEHVHSLDTLLGELCRSGFVIEDLQEPLRADAWAPENSAAHRALYFPPYLKVLARRRGPRTQPP